jgi:thiol-disulfide isomerase/thioredoxin/DNA-binding beta-propeller fold protein YncE
MDVRFLPKALAPGGQIKSEEETMLSRKFLSPLQPRAALGAAMVLAACLTSAGCGREDAASAPAPSTEQVAGEERAAGTPAVAAKQNEDAAAAERGSESPQNRKPPAAPSPPQPPDPQEAAAEANPDEAAILEEADPFPRRIPAPEFPEGMEWLNTGGPLRLADLKGKLVIFDFWTYCCINCIHILPELKKLEKKYPNELVVIGVHSAKFETEQEAENIKDAILRYEIEHPVVNDDQHAIWDSYGVRSWPTMLLIDPEGNAVWGRSGEFKAEQVEPILREAIAWYEKKGTLDRTPLRFDLLAHQEEETPLRFPGKVLADEAGARVFVADSNHNRIVVADLEGNLLDVIGSGAIGANDGDYRQATFDHPQGMAIQGDTLYVADTENHTIRKIDLKEKKVVTIAGIGSQARSGWPGLEKLGALDQPPESWMGESTKTALSSPWDLWIHNDGLYIAMAGTHQIWKMALDESEIGPYAGNGREDIVDGPLLPTIPYEEGYSAFAQPSGLTSDGEWLYVADSEGSSIRAVPFDPAGEVQTPIGTANLPYNRLFEFGDADGQGEEVRLQHALGVAWHDGKVYIADTYNSKVKELVLETKTVTTIAGGENKDAPDETAFDEPAGISYAAGKLYVADTNNHRIRTIDVASGNAVATLEIKDLAPPEPVEKPKTSAFATTPRTEVPKATLKPVDGKITLEVKIDLPDGWKINPLAPNGYRVEADGEAGPVDRAALGKMVRLEEPSATFTVELPVTGEGKDSLDVGVAYYYCTEGGEGLCKIGSAAWTVPIEISASAAGSTLEVTHKAPE